MGHHASDLLKTNGRGVSVHASLRAIIAFGLNRRTLPGSSCGHPTAWLGTHRFFAADRMNSRRERFGRTFDVLISEECFGQLVDSAPVLRGKRNAVDVENRNVFPRERLALSRQRQDRITPFETKQIVPKQVRPRDFVALPENVSKPFHRIVQCVRTGEENLLIEQLAFINQPS